MATAKSRSMCIICRKKRYKSKVVPIVQSVTLFPYKVKRFNYNVCKVGCLEKVQNMDLENTIKIVRSE
jgi:hypothetical protein